MFTFAFVSAVGIVTAGLVCNAWPLLTGRVVSLALLENRDILMPVRAMVLVLSAPILLIRAGFGELVQTSNGVLKWWMTLPVAMGWAFVQGVVVVVTLSAFS